MTHEIKHFRERLHPSKPKFKHFDLNLELEKESPDQDSEEEEGSKELSLQISPEENLILKSWSPIEKKKFYSSVARHSKLRPDLISRDIGTKSSSMVSALIEIYERLSVESSISQNSRFQDLSMVEKNVKIMKLFPIATEVSKDWLEMEEKEALKLCMVETEEGLTDYRRGCGDRIDEVKEILGNLLDRVVDCLDFRGLDSVYGRVLKKSNMNNERSSLIDPGF